MEQHDWQKPLVPSEGGLSPKNYKICSKCQTIRAKKGKELLYKQHTLGGVSRWVSNEPECSKVFAVQVEDHAWFKVPVGPYEEPYDICIFCEVQRHTSYDSYKAYYYIRDDWYGRQWFDMGCNPGEDYLLEQNANAFCGPTCFSCTDAA